MFWFSHTILQNRDVLMFEILLVVGLHLCHTIVTIIGPSSSLLIRSLEVYSVEKIKMQQATSSPFTCKKDLVYIELHAPQKDLWSAGLALQKLTHILTRKARNGISGRERDDFGWFLKKTAIDIGKNGAYSYEKKRILCFYDMVPNTLGVFSVL